MSQYDTSENHQIGVELFASQLEKSSNSLLHLEGKRQYDIAAHKTAQHNLLVENRSKTVSDGTRDRHNTKKRKIVDFMSYSQIDSVAVTVCCKKNV